jgi:hypothetical protein
MPCQVLADGYTTGKSAKHDRQAASITAGSTAGITAGSVYGITAGSTSGITAGSTAGITAGSTSGFVEPDSILAGPVASVDRVNGVFEAMGQTIMASPEMLRGLSKGDMVTVNGSVIGSGWLYADSIDVSSERYVPGATPVMVTGFASSVDERLGTAQLGGLTVDYTAALSVGRLPDSHLIRFSGIQPARGGHLMSDVAIAAD